MSLIKANAHQVGDYTLTNEGGKLVINQGTPDTVLNPVGVFGLNGLEVEGGTVQDALDAVTGPNGAASIGYTPAGTGAVPTEVETQLRKTLFAENYGVSSTKTGVENMAALNKALAVAGNKYKVRLPSGPIELFGTLKATTPGMLIKGETNCFTYGTSALGTTLRWTGFDVGDTKKRCVDTYLNDTDATPQPYITLENLCIDGNGIALEGFSGGFVSTLNKVSIIGCTPIGGAGLVLSANAQTSAFNRCAFNANYDGIRAEGSNITTMDFFSCATRQNIRYGYNGPAAAGAFYSHIFESNGSSGINFTGACRDLQLTRCYFEQNDAALGSSGYHIRAEIIGDSENIVLQTCTFGSIGTTKIANVQSGKLHFSHCSQTGETISPQITVGYDAEVTVHRSFAGYQLGDRVKIIPEVVVDSSKGLNLGSTGSVIINNPPIAFGNGDFTISTVVEPDFTATPIRTITSGNADSLMIQLVGSATGQDKIAFFKKGVAAFHISNVQVRPGTPTHIVYSRSGGVGYLYVNGSFVDNFADTNNYSMWQSRIGYDEGANYLNGTVYAFSIWTLALTDSEIFQIWRKGGNARSISQGPVFDLDFENRVSGRGQNRAVKTQNSGLIFTGNAEWVSPTSIPSSWETTTQSGAAIDFSGVKSSRSWVEVIGNVTSVFMPSLPSDGQIFTIKFRQGNAWTISGWPATVKLSGGAYTLTATVGKHDTLSFIFDAEANAWFESSRSLNC